jgi:hypothetical protein
MVAKMPGSACIIKVVGDRLDFRFDGVRATAQAMDSVCQTLYNLRL